MIAAGDEAEHRRYAVSVQRAVLTATEQHNWSAAYKASAELLRSSQQPQLAAPIAKEIEPGACEADDGSCDTRWSRATAIA